MKFNTHMKISIFFIVLCLLSCESPKDDMEVFVKNLVADCITFIGKEVPETFSYVNDYRYIKTMVKNHDNPVEISIVLTVDSEIVESCNVSIFFSDSLEARQYYDHINSYLDKESWDFINFISAYKRPKGSLYQKDEIYFGIYEPTPRAIPMSFSKNINLNGFYEPQDRFYEPQPEMVFDSNYYKNKIIEYRDFFDERQEISAIVKIDSIVPGLLSFLVCWNDNLKGYIYELYTFDKSQNIVQKYFIGICHFLTGYRDILMEKLPGTKIEHELVAFGDFNNNGRNEIISYSFVQNMGYGFSIFSIYEYNSMDNDFTQICLVPVFINFEKPFAPVEHIENGFRILEIVDTEYSELVWNEYTYDVNTGKYMKK